MTTTTDWQPIETAPRDGTPFVICRYDEWPDSLEAGRYDPSMFYTYESFGNGLFRRNEEIGYEWRGFNNFHRATHWMPLPPPPKVQP